MSTSSGKSINFRPGRCDFNVRVGDDVQFKVIFPYVTETNPDTHKMLIATGWGKTAILVLIKDDGLSIDIADGKTTVTVTIPKTFTDDYLEEATADDNKDVTLVYDYKLDRTILKTKMSGLLVLEQGVAEA